MGCRSRKGRSRPSRLRRGASRPRSRLLAISSASGSRPPPGTSTDGGDSGRHEGGCLARPTERRSALAKAHLWGSEAGREVCLVAAGRDGRVHEAPSVESGSLCGDVWSNIAWPGGQQTHVG